MNTETGQTGCHCNPDWAVYYWRSTDECYEQESPGPCPAGQYFAYNTTSKTTECNCFKNFVYHPQEGTCIEQFTQVSKNRKLVCSFCNFRYFSGSLSRRTVGRRGRADEAVEVRLRTAYEITLLDSRWKVLPPFCKGTLCQGGTI